MRRKITVTPTFTVFHYETLVGVYNQTRHNVSEVLKVQVRDYSRSRMFVATSEVKRLSAKDIEQRIETFLDTTVTALGYCYEAVLSIIDMPLVGTGLSKYYPALMELRKALNMSSTSYDNPSYPLSPEIFIKERTNKVILALEDMKIKTAREMERIIRSAL